MAANKLRARMLLLFAALACPWSAQAARPLVLAFDPLPPWKTVQDDNYGGAYTDIVRELARRVALPLQVVDCPLKRCLFMLEQGTADIAIGYKDSAARRRFLHFLATPYRTRSADKVFYVRQEHGARIRNYQDLGRLRIGVKLGADYFARFDADAALTKDPARGMEANFRKLALGRLDAVLIAEDQGEALLARLGMQGVLAKAPFRQRDPTPRAVALSKRSPHADRLADLNQAMAAMARDGTLGKIYRRYDDETIRAAADAVRID